MFAKVPIVQIRNGKSLKDHLVRASIPILNQTLGSGPCGKRNCQVCQFIVNTDTFSAISTDETFKIKKGPLNCNSKKVVYFQNVKNVKILMWAKLKQNFLWGWIIIKVLTNPSKPKKEKHRNYFMDIMYRMIMKVRTTGNLFNRSMHY